DLGKSRSNVPFTIPLTATIDGQAVPGLNSVQVRNFQPLIVKESMWGFVSLRVDISNPSGVAFDGYFNANVSLTDATGIVPVHLATGDLSTWVTVPLPKAATQYGQNILDASYNVISTGTESYVSFPQFKDAATIAANYTNNLLVQNTVMSTSAVTAPAMTGGPAHFYLNATYSFSGASGSMEQIYAAQNLNQTIPSGVRFLRFWLKGDGTANAVSMRFVDNTGQAFQMNGMGTAANTDWRLVEIPLDDYNPFFEFSSGGAGDGKIHFPIHWDSLLLIQSLTGACTGSVQISSPMYFY
ncbi:MAG TPA: hypothetical protein VN132_02745, partial [Bdellovibrio sp.]|nr:hypothetical protein [Bdellovibrio sp.]